MNGVGAEGGGLLQGREGLDGPLLFECGAVGAVLLEGVRLALDVQVVDDPRDRLGVGRPVEIQALLVRFDGFGELLLARIEVLLGARLLCQTPQRR